MMRERDEGRWTPKGKPTGQAMDEGRETMDPYTSKFLRGKRETMGEG